jgi:hypothetical protein
MQPGAASGIVNDPASTPSRCGGSTEARGDLYAIADEIEALKLQIASLPSRANVSRLALRATATIWVSDSHHRCDRRDMTGVSIIGKSPICFATRRGRVSSPALEESTRSTP